MTARTQRRASGWEERCAKFHREVLEAVPTPGALVTIDSVDPGSVAGHPYFGEIVPDLQQREHGVGHLNRF
jgi:hypothetical protein